MTFRRWDVVAVPYPFIEGTEAKRRPALIVSTDRLSEGHGLYWVVMITTAKTGRRADDVPIADHRRAGLPEQCVVRVSRITTLSEQLIDRRLGAIGASERNAVQGLLKRFLG